MALLRARSHPRPACGRQTARCAAHLPADASGELSDLGPERLHQHLELRRVARDAFEPGAGGVHAAHDRIAPVLGARHLVVARKNGPGVARPGLADARAVARVGGRTRRTVERGVRARAGGTTRVDRAGVVVVAGDGRPDAGTVHAAATIAGRADVAAWQATVSGRGTQPDAGSHAPVRHGPAHTVAPPGMQTSAPPMQ
jgi:hypothetical protein